jgi:hypothetical protein
MRLLLATHRRSIHSGQLRECHLCGDRVRRTPDNRQSRCSAEVVCPVPETEVSCAQLIRPYSFGYRSIGEIRRERVPAAQFTVTAYNRTKAMKVKALRELPPRHRRGRHTRAVELGDQVHLLRRQLRGYDAHLLVNVILPKPLGEGHELALDIGGLLRL